jgi:HEAT repeat protein
MMGFLLPPEMPNIKAALRDAAHGSPEAKWVAALALGQENGAFREAAIQALVELMKSPHEEIRAQALEGIAEQSRHGAAVDSQLVLSALEDPSPAVRATAVDTLSEMDISALEVDFHGLLADPDPSVRIAAAAAAADMEYIDSTPLLTSLLDDSVPTVRLQAAISLAVFGDPAGIPELKKGLTLPPREAVEAIRALGDLGAAVPEATLTALEQLFAKRFIDTELRATAAVALFCCSAHTRGDALIARLLTARNTETRLAALSALARLPAGASAGALVQRIGGLLTDRVPLVVSCAIETLGALAASTPLAVTTLEQGREVLDGKLLQELEECLAMIYRNQP